MGALEAFGGLNLIADPGEVGFAGSIDELDCEHDRDGRLRSRDGFKLLTAAPAAGGFQMLAPYYKTDGTKQLLGYYGGASGALVALSTAGAVLATYTTGMASLSYASVARFGGPGAEEAYIAVSGAAGATVVKWNGSSFSAVTFTGTTPTGRHVAVTPDNRLVFCRRNGTAQGDNPSTIQFSEAGQPANCPSTYTLDLVPGDGEELMGVVVWRELTFVFKETKFAVLPVALVGSGGTPQWNYRLVASQGLAGGAGGAAYRAICVAPHGVYFANRRGIWLTDGGPPELVSRDVDPLFVGNVESWHPAAINIGALARSALLWHDQKLWFAHPSGAATKNDRILRLDPATGAWSLYSLPAQAMASFRVADQEEFVFALDTGAPVLISAPGPAAGSAIRGAGALVQGTTYYYVVTAVNTAGETTASNEVTAIVYATPATPGGLASSTDGWGGVGKPVTASYSADGPWNYVVTAHGPGGQAESACQAGATINTIAPFDGVHWNKISWNAVPGAAGYYVYRRLGVGGTWYRIADVAAGTLSYADFGDLRVPGTAISPPLSGSPGDAQRVSLTWPAVPGAVSYRVYRGTVAGAENAWQAAAVNNFTDTGAVGTAGTPPVANTASVSQNDVGRHNASCSADGGNGTTTGRAIAARYRTGFAALADGAEARLRELILTGFGPVEVSAADDFGALEDASVVQLGAAPAVDEGRYRRARRARKVSLQLASSGGAPWLVNRVEVLADLARRVVQR